MKSRFPSEHEKGLTLVEMMIAMALSSRPKLLLLDEPTTALDPQTRTVIIDLLRKLQEEMGFKMLFVTHDMHSAEALCDEICVIQKGRIVEAGSMEQVLEAPRSDYTRTLIGANFSHREFKT